MRNFGKLSQTPEIVEVGDGKMATILVLRDVNGVEWHDLFKQNPHAWYIAVDGDQTIISMENDPEQSQISGYDIWGIDSNFGFTRGPGGSVYGKIWNGTAISSRQAKPESTLLSPDQFYGLLEGLGKLDQFMTEIENIVPMAKKLTCRNQFNNSVSFSWDMALIEVVSPKVWGDNWKDDLALAWIEAAV